MEGGWTKLSESRRSLKCYISGAMASLCLSLCSVRRLALQTNPCFFACEPYTYYTIAMTRIKKTCQAQELNTPHLLWCTLSPGLEKWVGWIIRLPNGHVAKLTWGLFKSTLPSLTDVLGHQSQQCLVCADAAGYGLEKPS